MNKRISNRVLQKRRTRIRLRREQGNNCYYCDCVMDTRVEARIHKRPNAETIEHLHYRLEGRKGWGQGKKVLACYQCNHKLGQIMDIYHNKEKTMRTRIGRLLVFHTSHLHPSVGIRLRRLGRKILFRKH